MRTLTNENDKLKQHSHQTERIIAQYKRENEELQQKVINMIFHLYNYSIFYQNSETKKRNDDLFNQEFNKLRNDLK